MHSDRYKLRAGCVVLRYDGFSEKPKLSNDAVRLVHGWVTAVTEVRRTVGRINAVQNRYRMTPGVRHSGIVNNIDYLF